MYLHQKNCFVSKPEKYPGGIQMALILFQIPGKMSLCSEVFNRAYSSDLNTVDYKFNHGMNIAFENRRSHSEEEIKEALHLKMVILSKEDLREIRTLSDLDWTRIYEHRVANTLRGARDWKLQTIYDACRKIRTQGGSIERKQGSGRPRTIWTEENMRRVEALLKSPPRIPGTHLSARKVASGAGISRRSIQRIAEDRGLKCLKKTKVHKIPIPKRRRETNEQRRVRLCRGLLGMGDHLVTNGIFTDEAPFHLNANLSTQNQCVYTTGRKRDVRRESLQLETSHLNFELKLMVLAAISDKRTQRYLLEHAPFIPKEDWPGYSPDINPCDYRLWAWMKQKVYEGGMPQSLDALKARITEVWDALDAETIRKWLRELRPRLQKVVDEDGKPMQQYFNKV
uniref:Transposase n=1 Tax=Acrobeloides nanus TaxID=290746 RepID=A0A914CPY7_9BILA